MQDTKEDLDAVWYFAFGSMCNPVSINRRGLIPSDSKPAMIQGYQLAFQLGGMANLVPNASASCHGILHHITADMFKVLCKIEATYDIVSVLATPYEAYEKTPIAVGSSSSSSSSSGSGRHSNCKPAAGSNSTCVLTDSSSTDASANQATAPGTPGRPITATAFIVQPEHLEQLRQQHPEWRASLPSERYVSIITAGLRHHGVDPAWVQRVAAEPHTPGKIPEQYLKFPDPENADALPTFTAQQLTEYQGKILDNKVVMACGHKVVEVDISPQPNAPYVVYLRDHMSGRCTVYGTCMNLYEPKLPPLESPADLTQEHVDWCENFSMEWMKTHKFGIRQIGWLEGHLGAAAGTVHGL